jgi:hypothetical protein
MTDCDLIRRAMVRALPKFEATALRARVCALVAAASLPLAAPPRPRARHSGPIVSRYLLLGATG